MSDKQDYENIKITKKNLKQKPYRRRIGYRLTTSLRENKAATAKRLLNNLNSIYG